ncbi:MAG TPA: cation transporter [Clostridia bacterium]|nr:cation transporter [Clostridia bacterium]
MKKTLVVEGMSCGHCAAHVEKALNAIEGVNAKVNLNAKTASVELISDANDDTLKAAVEDAGYEVVGIK